MNVRDLNEADFERIRGIFYRDSGICLGPEKRDMVNARLLKRLRLLNLPDFTGYLNFLETDSTERAQLLDLLTTHETRFFREKEHFDFLADYLKKYKQGKLRIWSAACSTGEEVYSLAMVCSDMLPAGTDYQVTGSDISPESVAMARFGEYPMERTADIPAEYLRRFCLRGIEEREGYFLIDDPIRRHTHFLTVNLREIPPDLGFFDVILLRNILIYFGPEERATILRNVHRHLMTDGLLILGHVENPDGIGSRLERLAPSIYRKPHD